MSSASRRRAQEIAALSAIGTYLRNHSKFLLVQNIFNTCGRLDRTKTNIAYFQQALVLNQNKKQKQRSGPKMIVIVFKSVLKPLEGRRKKNARLALDAHGAVRGRTNFINEQS